MVLAWATQFMHHSWVHHCEPIHSLYAIVTVFGCVATPTRHPYILQCVRGIDGRSAWARRARLSGPKRSSPWHRIRASMLSLCTPPTNTVLLGQGPGAHSSMWVLPRGFAPPGGVANVGVQIPCGWRFGAIPTVAVGVVPPTVRHWEAVCKRCARAKQDTLGTEAIALKKERSVCDHT